MNKKRIIYFDYLRIFAIFSVVVLHILAQSWEILAETWEAGDVKSFEWNVLNFYNGFMRWGVPVFVMISGSLFLGKEQTLKKLYSKNILRIFIVFVFWSVLYAAWDNFFIYNDFSVKNLVREIVLGHYHLWFLYMIIGLYMIVPFLNKIIENKKIAFYFVVLSFLFAFLLPQCTEIIGLKSHSLLTTINKVMSKLDLHLVLGYSGYFVLGYLINQVKIKKKTEYILYILGLLSIAFTIISTLWASDFLKKPTNMFHDNMDINILLMSTAVFVFAKLHMNKPIKNEKTEKLLLFCSKCSFGVYLVHPLFIEGLYKIKGISALSFNPILSVPILSIVVFILSLLISVLLNKIPFLNKWIV